MCALIRFEVTEGLAPVLSDQVSYDPQYTPSGCIAFCAGIISNLCVLLRTWQKSLPFMHDTKFSAGIIVIHGHGTMRRYLLLRAFRNWDFPKGLVEPDEEPLQAAIREVEEETAIADLNFRWGYDYRETPPYGQKKIARYYVAEMRSAEVHLPISAELGKPEHDEYRWVSYEEAISLLPERLVTILDWARDYAQE